MPELPEVETVRQGVAPVMEGRRLLACTLRRPDLRWPIPPDLVQMVTGKTCATVERRAKYLLIRFATGSVSGTVSGPVLLLHLGMSGSLTVAPLQDHPPPRTHDHVLFDFAGPDPARAESGATRVTFHDPRRFGSLDLADAQTLPAHPRLQGLGPEPFDEDSLTPERFLARCEGKRTSLKALLLDQRVIAGLGNIYVCESLFRAKLSPLRQAGSLTKTEAKRLLKAVRTVLQEAIDSGGSSLRDHRQSDGTLGYFQHRFQVYDHAGEPCPRCGTAEEIERIVQNGRSTFYCNACQL
ncbi:MAG: bifunctional DNA-formamidopyrimidine glycosylase/DNA-(apurinic or apyrimidinic site) lyase [Rhodospirillaceae bacterium]